ncbi:unnamed protein product, partial [Iphiclides podalirius]
MVPQQISEVRSLTPTSSGVPVFGSQLVDKNSSTPYTDATQAASPVVWRRGVRAPSAMTFACPLLFLRCNRSNERAALPTAPGAATLGYNASRGKYQVSSSMLRSI